MRLEYLLDENSSGGEMFPQAIVIEPQPDQMQVVSIHNKADQNVVKMFLVYLFF